MLTSRQLQSAVRMASKFIIMYTNTSIFQEFDLTLFCSPEMSCRGKVINI